jgi:4-hydroxy-3-polyprenylbenzoate decarboxylase
MMFNKIMAVTDAGVDLTDYRALLRAISMHTDPLSGIHFLRGPVDILDHASSRYAYGSKMGIDATPVLPGEGEASAPAGSSVFVDTQAIVVRFPEVTEVMDRLTETDISLVILAVNKDAQVNLRAVAAGILKEDLIRGVKFIVFTDAVVDPANLAMVTWIAANNLDPVRDCFYIDREPGHPYPCLFIDGTRKTPENDRFSRDWPNVIVMDDDTIQKIDRTWAELMPVPLIPSPSHAVSSLASGTGAVYGTC